MLDHVPDTTTQYRVAPAYEQGPGWQTDTSDCRSWHEMPERARAYLRRIEALAGAHPLCAQSGAARCCRAEGRYECK